MSDGGAALPADATLLLIDLQEAILHPTWGRLSNPAVPEQAARLLAAWRRAGRPRVHVFHASTEAASPYRPGQPGADPLPAVRPLPGEPVVVKSAHSAFVGTDLRDRLGSAPGRTLVLTGVLTHNSLDATARHAADLGYRVVIVPEATSAAEKRDLDGRLWAAEEVQALALACLAGEYAEVVPLERLLASAG